MYVYIYQFFFAKRFMPPYNQPTFIDIGFGPKKKKLYLTDLLSTWSKEKKFQRERGGLTLALIRLRDENCFQKQKQKIK